MICDWIALQYPILREDSKWVKFFEKFMGYLKSTAPNAEDADVIGEDARSVKNVQDTTSFGFFRPLICFPS